MFLENKIALVTGGSRGIGKAIALALAEKGAQVGINFYPGDEDQAQKVVEEIKALGGKALAVVGDVRDRISVGEMVDIVESQLGVVDILVNNAGITRDNLFLRMKDDDWDQVIATNLTGVYNCSKAVIRNMIKRRQGRIINIASVVGLIGNPGQANYGAAKAGVIGFTKCLAREVGGRGITVNAVAPGFIETEMTKKLSQEARESFLQKIPLGKAGKPQDVAEVVVFFASSAAAYLTGQVVHVDGGMII